MTKSLLIYVIPNKIEILCESFSSNIKNSFVRRSKEQDRKKNVGIS